MIEVPILKTFFSKFILQYFRKGTRNSHIHGITYGWTQSFLFFAYATAFYYGSHLIANGELIYTDMLK